MADLVSRDERVAGVSSADVAALAELNTAQRDQILNFIRDNFSNIEAVFLDPAAYTFLISSGSKDYQFFMAKVEGVDNNDALVAVYKDVVNCLKRNGFDNTRITPAIVPHAGRVDGVAARLVINKNALLIPGVNLDAQGASNQGNLLRFLFDYIHAQVMGDNLVFNEDTWTVGREVDAEPGAIQVVAAISNQSNVASGNNEYYSFGEDTVNHPETGQAGASAEESGAAGAATVEPPVAPMNRRNNAFQIVADCIEGGLNHLQAINVFLATYGDLVTSAIVGSGGTAGKVVFFVPSFENTPCLIIGLPLDSSPEEKVRFQLAISGTLANNHPNMVVKICNLDVLQEMQGGYDHLPGSEGIIGAMPEDSAVNLLAYAHIDNLPDDPENPPVSSVENVMLYLKLFKDWVDMFVTCPSSIMFLFRPFTTMRQGQERSQFGLFFKLRPDEASDDVVEVKLKDVVTALKSNGVGPERVYPCNIQVEEGLQVPTLFSADFASFVRVQAQRLKDESGIDLDTYRPLR